MIRARIAPRETVGCQNLDHGGAGEERFGRCRVWAIAATSCHGGRSHTWTEEVAGANPERSRSVGLGGRASHSLHQMSTAPAVHTAARLRHALSA